MRSFERILAVVDPYAEAQPAVHRAAVLAHKSAATVDLLICNYDDHLAGTRFGDSDGLRASRKQMMESARDALERLAGPLRNDGLEVNVHTVFYHPLHEGIISKASELGSDLVVKDTHYHHLLKRTVFANTDWELIRECPVDLMLIKTDGWSADPVILAAVDPSHIGDKPARLDHAILRQGMAINELLGGTLRVVHNYPLSLPAAAVGAGLATPGSDTQSLNKSIEQTHRQALDRLLQGYEIGADNVLLVAGEPRRQLVAMAQSQHADIMVVGAVSRSRLKRVFLGFTALHILDRLPCDLLIVKARAVLT
ncbi:MAG: universal stress protein [Gammaproteobacteria bacterium]|nr:universal stress protein [Gammaproteobacteria bacterium]MDH3768367.1 universal stress protein [Gammaproteobacteria bacterium]